jgi:hypothetical protein
MSLTTVEFLLGPLPEVIVILVVAIVGTIFAIRRRRSQPMASRLVIIGFCALLVDAIGSYAVRIYSYRSYDRYEDAYVQARHIAELYAVLHSINVLGVILIAAAVFANRVSVRESA